ncbi:MAG: hypothetical protein HYY16_02305 [Planctomycetes bacterium]|nr:hypothetical protein [Planctomycetota bacterium]
MDDKELRKWETTYREKTGKDPTVTIPPGGAAEDIPEFVKRAGVVKVELKVAKKAEDASRVAELEARLQLFKRVVRARAMQRELNRLEGRVNGYLTPWPE